MTHDRGPALRWALIVTALYILQIGVAVDLRLFGVHPELMLLVAICAGMTGGAARGAEIGFFAGLLMDLVLRGTLGITALSYALVGFGVGVLGESMLRASRAISAAICLAASAAGLLLYASVAHLLGQQTLADPRLGAIVGIVALCNAVLCVPVLALSRWAEGAGLRSRLV